MNDRRYAMVTGAASGLGRAFALRLAREGWHIALVDINDAGSAETLQQVEAAGGSGQAEHLDVADPQQWAALRERLQAAWPRLDLLVNAAGVAVAGEVGAVPLDDWHWLFGITFFGTVYGCHEMTAWLKQNPRGGAAIINVASIAGVASPPAMAAYNSAKAAVLTFSETLYAELRQHGVGVTVAFPGFFLSRLMASARCQSEDQRKFGQNSMEKASFTADDVARESLQAAAKRRLYVVLPRRARIWWRAKRLMPRTVMRLLARIYAKGVPESV